MLLVPPRDCEAGRRIFRMLERIKCHPTEANHYLITLPSDKDGFVTERGEHSLLSDIIFDKREGLSPLYGIMK